MATIVVAVPAVFILTKNRELIKRAENQSNERTDCVELLQNYSKLVDFSELIPPHKLRDRDIWTLVVMLVDNAPTLVHTQGINS